MTSEEYVQILEELMAMQDRQVNWLFTVLGLLIALAAFYQWRVSTGDKETLRKEIDNKTSSLRKEFENQFSIENGSNDNGHWVRYPDGNQLCRHTISIDKDRHQEDITWTYPAAFSGMDINVFSEVDDPGKIKIKKVIKKPYSTVIFFELLDEAYEGKDIKIDLLAYGYWKPFANK